MILGAPKALFEGDQTAIGAGTVAAVLTYRRRARDKKARFAAHPVASHLSSHMNVPLVEIKVAYGMALEMDEIDGNTRRIRC